MKIKDITLSNIRAFVEGTTRNFLEEYGPLWAKVTPTVKDQVVYRSMKCKPCLDNGSCLKCGCSTPSLFYASKGCRIGKYPMLLNEKSWNTFKLNEEEGNKEANRKYYQVWKCSCNELNAYPYNYCHSCKKEYTGEQILEMISDYRKNNDDIHNKKQ